MTTTKGTGGFIPLAGDSVTSKKDQDNFTQLAKWQNVGERIWPFVRFWGLCGASPEALDVMKDLAELLGEEVIAQPIAEEMVSDAASQLTSQLVNKIIRRMEDDNLSRRVGPRVVEDLRQMMREEYESLIGG